MRERNTANTLRNKNFLGTITDAMLLKKLPFEAECHNQGHFAKSTQVL